MKTFVHPLPALLATLVLAAGCSPPCTSPVEYRIGRVDSGFGLPEQEFRALVERAEEVWEDASGRDLFRYDPGAALVVNLVYDERQRTAQDNARRTQEIGRVGGWADDAKARYDRTRRRYEDARDEYLAARSAHDARIDAFNRKVADWNSRGGAPPARLAELEREEAGIGRRGREIEAQRLEVNELASKANRQSDRYNDLADEVNENVAAVNATAGREFRQGRYVQDASGVRIDVYEYEDRMDLVHVLAHELGHAIGIFEHSANPEAIMFGDNSTRHLAPTREDLALLQKVCDP